VRGWVWPGSQRLANQGQGAWPGAVNQEILDSYSSVGPLRGTTTTCVELKGDDFSCYSNKIESVIFSGCPYDH